MKTLCKADNSRKAVMVSKQNSEVCWNQILNFNVDYVTPLPFKCHSVTMTYLLITSGTQGLIRCSLHKSGILWKTSPSYWLCNRFVFVYFCRGELQHFLWMFQFLRKDGVTPLPQTLRVTAATSHKNFRYQSSNLVGLISGFKIL